ncbi:hypothetical protein tb265_18450 [Gemmatimonadetes bacterium T265]|nr:hypothetical protein tb265_18450 [Gemmatimonadetes bacterium T265]
MPAVAFDSLPDDARLWVFAAADPLDADGEAELLAAADAFLAGWAAHGAPLRAAREWRDGRFLAVAVDQSTAGASGCSIDGLFRSLRALEPTLGTSLLAAGRVYWRDADGRVRGGDRAALRGAAAAGAVDEGTPVFDTTVTTVADWRARFERPLAESWHARIVAPAAARGV